VRTLTFFWRCLCITREMGSRLQVQARLNADRYQADHELLRWVPQGNVPNAREDQRCTLGDASGPERGIPVG
jgi:hypothetical protein